LWNLSRPTSTPQTPPAPAPPPEPPPIHSPDLDSLLGEDDNTSSIFREDNEEWEFTEAYDPYHHDLDIHAIKTCTFDPVDQGVPDIDLTSSHHVVTDTRTYDPSITTPFDLWLAQNQHTPPILSKSHHQLLHTLHPDPVSAADIDLLQDTAIQQLHQFDYEGPRAHYDLGSQASTTNKSYHLHNYREFPPNQPCQLRLVSADGTRCHPLGYGFCRLPDSSTSTGYRDIFTYHTPDIPSTILSPSSLIKQIPPDLSDGWTITANPNGTFTFEVAHKQRTSENIRLHGIISGGLLYTAPLILPSAPTPRTDPTPPETATSTQALLQELTSDLDWQNDAPELLIHKLNATAERLLWHQRLDHICDQHLCDAHKYVDGVPQFKTGESILGQCPICLPAKMKKRSPGPNTTRKATVPYQGLGFDFAFTGQKSKNRGRAVHYTGLNGETCYILGGDHFTGRLHGEARVGKGAPIEWLRAFLTRYSPGPDIKDKYVYLDQGGELYNHPAIRRLFTSFGYDIFPTGADSSHQNGFVERSHGHIGDALRAKLTGSNLDARFWPYAFKDYIRKHNAIRHAPNQTISAYEAATHKRENFRDLRTFGCRVWVRPPGKRKAKLRLHARKGIFLGYLEHTLKNIMWYDLETKRVKIAFHARFDEGMNDLPALLVPPNVQHLQRVQNGDPLPADLTELTATSLTFSDSPFINETDEIIPISCNHPLFGLLLTSDALSSRVYISEISDRSSALRIRSTPTATRRRFTGAFITAIDDQPVFTKNDALTILRRLRTSTALKKFSITLAAEPLPTKKDRDSATLEGTFNDYTISDIDPDDDLEITTEDLRAIHSVLVDNSDIYDLTIDEVDLFIHFIQADAATPEERQIGKYTRSKLRKLSTWPEWRAAEHKQLDRFDLLGMHGTPRPPPATGDGVVIHPMWSYAIKTSGERRSRRCGDGSARRAPDLRSLAKTYSSCVSQTGERLFMALAAKLNYTIWKGDVRDAYAHSPGPETPTFIRICDQFADWYQARKGHAVNRSHVIPLLRALQGHPEAGRLWEDHINKILLSPAFGFTNTTHEQNIYQAVIDGVKVLLLRQVDDFLLATPDPAIADDLYQRIGAALQQPDEKDIPFVNEGIATEFNGVDVKQTRDYIQLSSESYIHRLLKTHGWDTPVEDSSPPREPLPHDSYNVLFTSVGPVEGSPEANALATEFGYTYRGLLGELMFPYVTTRIDIGLALTVLSKFSTAPARIHFISLKRIAKYLRRTAHWGLIYWRSTPNPDLPHVPIDPVPSHLYPDDLPPYPEDLDPHDLVAVVDASHANDLRTKRSTTGYAFLMSGAAVAFRVKTQPVVATSSTEAEFFAAVHAGKVCRYLRSILRQLGFPPSQPTVIFEDNQSCINIVNQGKPTERTRHVDIQWFAIQEWRSAGDLVLKHLPGKINPADALTKPLGRILHERHCRRLLGHYGYRHMRPT
jgi:hypothetical protein